MRALLISLLLCLTTFAASADCLRAAAPQAADVAQRRELVRAAGATAPIAAQARDGTGAFIKTRNPAAPPAAEEKAEGKRNDRRGSFMLLAALAIMSAIALRHAAASRR